MIEASAISIPKDDLNEALDDYEKPAKGELDVEKSLSLDNDQNK